MNVCIFAPFKAKNSSVDIALQSKKETVDIVGINAINGTSVLLNVKHFLVYLYQDDSVAAAVTVVFVVVIVFTS